MRSPNDLMGVELASPELISAISSKRDAEKKGSGVEMLIAHS